MPRELPQFYIFPHSHGNITFLQKWKKMRENKKRVVYIRGSSHTCAFSSKVQEHSRTGSCPQVPLPPSLKRTHSYENLP
jgi:hypothetical protein